MLNKKVYSTLKKCEIVLLFWIFLSVTLCEGVTKCGWIFRNNLINPTLSWFDSSYNLTVIPVINANKAWCIPVKNHSLTVNLGSVTNVTRLAVQGENGTENYVTSYEVDHSEDGIIFTNIKNGLKPQCSAKEFFGAFPGLSTGSDIAESNLTISFRAQYVRFRPQESVGDLCTRVDIYGCQSDDGFTTWSSWSACTSTPRTQTGCSRSRTRTCENRSEGCKGIRNDTEACARSQCPGECGELGIIDDNRSINDTAFLASSFKPGFEPYRARLNGPNAWCASITDQNQYLEIDFGGETEVNEIKTQGLQKGNRSAWVTRFFLDFRRSDGSLWEDYTENNSVRIYEGNTNGSTVRTYVLADSPSARFIRFYPLDWDMEICMRVSVSGCRVPPILAPVASSADEDVDEAFWILLWVLLGLLLLLLLLGLLYLCCRYCPCCACCSCCPCVKKRAKKTDEAMMTELTSDEIDAPRAQYATGATQTDGAPVLPETETQTVAIHLGTENGRAATGAGAVYFSRREGREDRVDIPGARYNEGLQSRDDQIRVGGLASSRREEMMTSEARERSEVDAGRVAGIARDRSRDRMEEQRMMSSQYQREEQRSSAIGRGEYLGRYDVATSYPGQVSVGRAPLAPPPVIELEVSPDRTDGSWRVETIEQRNERLAQEQERRRGASELEYQGVSYRGMHDRDRARSVEGLGTSDVRGGGVVVRLASATGLGTSDSVEARTATQSEYTVHLKDVPPAGLARLQAEELDTRTARERYYDQDTYRARSQPEVETWKVTSIRGQAFQGTINVDTARGQVTGQPFYYQAPTSPAASSDMSSISQYNGSSVSEQHDERNSRKEKFYKMFEYSRD